MEDNGISPQMHSQISEEQHAVCLNLYLNALLFSLSLNVLHKKGKQGQSAEVRCYQHSLNYIKVEPKITPKETSLLCFHSGKAKARHSYLNRSKARRCSWVILKKDKEFRPEICDLKTWKKDHLPLLSIVCCREQPGSSATCSTPLCAAPMSTQECYETREGVGRFFYNL